jgi:hypothetical protein
MKIIETANQNEPNRARRIANMKLNGDLTCSGYDVQCGRKTAAQVRSFNRAMAQ